MTWTEDDPGAGDLGAVRALARRVDEAAQQLAEVRWDARSHTGDVTENAWSGTAGDAWRNSAEACVDNLGRLLDHLAPAVDILTGYADRVEEIADEAEDVHRRSALTQLQLDTMRPLPPDASPAARRRWTMDREDHQYALRHAREMLEELADRRRSADSSLRAELGPVRVGDWEPAGRVSVPASAGAGGGSAGLGIHPGAIALGQAVRGGLKLGTKSVAYGQYLRAVRAPVQGRPRATLRWKARADASLSRFTSGSPNGGVLGKVIGVRAATAAGWLFLPVTFVSGVRDAVTGGGYGGTRGAVTQGFGAVGAAGAGALAVSGLAGWLGASALVLNPVGATIAGAAVLAYGAWSLGNLIWDNREAIGDFLSSAANRVGDAWDATGRAVTDAVDWAREKVGNVAGKVADGLADAGRNALSVLSFGAL